MWIFQDVFFELEPYQPISILQRIRSFTGFLKWSCWPWKSRFIIAWTGATAGCRNWNLRVWKTRVQVPNASCFRCGSANLHLAIGGQWPAFHISTSGRILQLGGIFRIHCIAECFFMPFAEESSLASTWWLVICTKSQGDDDASELWCARPLAAQSRR